MLALLPRVGEGGWVVRSIAESQKEERAQVWGRDEEELDFGLAGFRGPRALLTEFNILQWGAQAWRSGGHLGLPG